MANQTSHGTCCGDTACLCGPCHGRKLADLARQTNARTDVPSKAEFKKAIQDGVRAAMNAAKPRATPAVDPVAERLSRDMGVPLSALVPGTASHAADPVAERLSRDMGVPVEELLAGTGARQVTFSLDRPRAHAAAHAPAQADADARKIAESMGLKVADLIGHTNATEPSPLEARDAAEDAADEAELVSLLHSLGVAAAKAEFDSTPEKMAERYYEARMAITSSWDTTPSAVAEGGRTLTRMVDEAVAEHMGVSVGDLPPDRWSVFK